MRDDIRNQLFKELSTHFRLIGFALLVFEGVLLTIRFQYNAVVLDFYILLVAISIVVLLVVSGVLFIGIAKTTKKNDE